MAEINVDIPEKPKKLLFNWIPGLIIRPKATFNQIGKVANGVWLTPLFLFSLTTLGRTLVQGWLRQLSASTGQINLPPEFQYYSPEQQAQMLQALESTSSPVFIYVLPAILGLAGVWLGWLIVSGLLHFVLTLLGGRGDTSVSLNLVAWASIPFAIRDLVRIVAMLITREPITAAGISGFAPAGDSMGLIYLVELMKLLDIYLLWHIALLVLGVYAAAKLASSKAWTGTMITMLIVLALQALPGFISAQFSNLTITRPFFF
jgi:hypothetical protein